MYGLLLHFTVTAACAPLGAIIFGAGMMYMFKDINDAGGGV